MSLEEMQANLRAWDEFDECRILNLNFGEEDNSFSAAALTRREGEATLWLVQQNPAYWERQEEYDPPPPPATNREQLLWKPVSESSPPAVGHLRAIRLGDQEYKINSSGHTPVNRDCNLDAFLTLVNLLRKGWAPPEPLSQVNADSLLLSTYQLREKFDALPPACPLTLLPDDRQEDEAAPIDCTLPFDGAPEPLPLPLPDDQTGWLIRAEWFDPWKHLEETLADPKTRARFTPEQLERFRRDNETLFETDLCPRGMALPVVFYEAPKDVSLNFYEKNWLDRPLPRSSGCAFGVTGLTKNTDVGPHGLPLRAAALTEVPLDPKVTQELSLGLMKWYRSRSRAPIGPLA